MMELNFEKFHGLVPVVIQDHVDGQVLMVGFMNQEAWKRTLAEGEVVYYSRSRDGMWKKGETSGNVQKVKDIFVDCDDDTLLITVEQVGGAACHTGYRTCFYRRVVDGKPVAEGERVFDPDDVYKKT